MKQVILKPLHHRGQENIGIYFENYTPLNTIVHKQIGAKWSQSNKCWYAPLNPEMYNKLHKALRGKAELNITALKNYLEKRKQKTSHTMQPVAIPAIKKNIQINSFRQPAPATAVKMQVYISDKNSHVLPAMKQTLVLKAYSPSTIKTYLNEMAQFLQTIKNHPADEFSIERIKKYLQYCFEKLKLTENTLHSRMNALKFYYEQVLRKQKFFWEIPRPKRPMQLPKVISKEEMVSLIRAIENVKHKTMIMLAYACGLRVSEITNLLVTDIHEDRRLLFIRRAKGKKDRVISLSPAMLVMLREYLLQYKPKQFLFEGQYPGTSYSPRSLESIIQVAKGKAGIKKSGSMHMLRHSFATHLLDKGTDVVFIQKLLGHNDIKTTLRYLHVTNKDILNILSPIEDIKDLLG